MAVEACDSDRDVKGVPERNADLAVRSARRPGDQRSLRCAVLRMRKI
jgi:hypothetical protein